MTDVLRELVPRGPRFVLDELAERSRQLAASNRARPEVELHLASGIVRGRVVATGDDRGTPIVVVHVDGAPVAPSVAYVRVDQVTAVVVRDAAVLARQVPADEPVPSRLDFTRRLTALADALGTRLGRAFAVNAPELDDDGRRAVARLLPVLGELVPRIAADTLGAQAIAALDGLELAAGPQTAAVRHGRTLAITAPRFALDATSPDELRALIERVL